MVIVKGESNTIALTLSEKATITPRVYVFQFIRDMNQEVVNAIFEPVTTNTRAEVFTVVEGTDITLDAGWWTYYVYEAEVESPQSDDPNDYSPALNLLEQGKCAVIGEAYELPAFDATATTKPIYQ